MTKSHDLSLNEVLFFLIFVTPDQIRVFNLGNFLLLCLSFLVLVPKRRLPFFLLDLVKRVFSRLSCVALWPLAIVSFLLLSLCHSAAANFFFLLHVFN